MIIARQKRKENICEYLLYMWQVEDLIRANHFDMEEIRRNVLSRYQQPEETMREIEQWYEELIEMMRSEGVKEAGHIQLNKNVIIDLGIEGDIKTVLKMLNERLAQQHGRQLIHIHTRNSMCHFVCLKHYCTVKCRLFEQFAL